jgi:hypothetical protein
MNDLGLPEYALVAEILLTIITFIGIITSIWLSVKALREVQTDRKMRHMPHLAFETGGHLLYVEFKKVGKRIPGINPKYVEKMFPNLPNDAESVRIKDIKKEDGSVEMPEYGRLVNYGLGPALSIEVTWKPEIIWIGSEKFTIDDKKLLEPFYAEELNSMPSDPGHILPGGRAGLTRLPTFVEKDFEKKVSRVEGVLEIECEDVFGEKHKTNQEFHLFTNYRDDKPSIIVTFGDLIIGDREH